MSATEVQPGYKLTEVGVLPEEWEVQPLGKQLQRPPQYGLNAAAIDHDEAFPTYLRITDISDDGRFVPAPRVSVKTSNKDAYLLGQGDLVIARTGASVGKSYLFSTSDGELVFAGYLIRFAPDPKKLDPHFLSLYTRSKPYWDWVSVMSARSGQPGINGREYADMPVPLPPLPEQRAIAAALGDVDALLAALERLIAKRWAVKQAAMDALLSGRVRLVESGEWRADSSALSSVHRSLSPVRYKLTEAGEIPEDWDSVRIEQIADIVSGGTPSTLIKEYWDGGIPWCTPSDITANSEKYLRETARTISTEGLRNSSATLLPTGTLLLCSRATIGEVKIAAQPTATNQGFKSLVVHPEVADNEFLYYKLLTLKSKLIERGVGSTFLEVSRRDVGSLPISFPSIPEQRAIAGVLSDMDAAIAALERQRAKVQAIKQGMMAELLTGRIRLVK